MHRKMLLLAVVVTTVVFVFVGCSGSGGPRLPAPVSPERPDPTRVHLQSLIVPGGETMRVEQDTVYVVEETVIIDGELIGADGSGAGAQGVDITIECQGNISVAGLIKAGSGAGGAPDEAGGAGGSVSLTSSGGNITIGTEAGIAAANSGSRGVHAGDAGAGGDGLLGGAGGKGGSVVLVCAAGTLTIHEAPDLFHVGNGGHGGQGVVAGDDLETFEPPAHLIIPIEETGIELPQFDDPRWEGEAPEEFELPDTVLQAPGHGGQGGRFGIRAAAIEGPETEAFVDEEAGEMTLVFLSEEVADGGDGGDAGDFFFGVDPETAEPVATQGGVRPRSDGPSIPANVQGAHGGSGFPSGGAGGLAHVAGLPGIKYHEHGDPWVHARGGDGGAAEWSSDLDNSVTWSTRMRGGRGGAATAWSLPGEDGGPCERGQDGDSAYAEGGRGGDIRGFGAHRVLSFPGRGGEALSVSGWGGNGGHCCQPPGKGGDGGRGGYATALGGDGGRSFDVPGPEWGIGGNARGNARRGGSGGDGWPPGEGGGAGICTVSGGRGRPEGNAKRERGQSGADGKPCPEAPEPDPEPTPEPRVPTGYAVSSSSTDDWFFVQQGWYSSAIGPQQSGSFTIGGDNYPVRPRYGNSIIVNRDSSKLWALDELSGIAMFSNPLTGGDRPADRVLGLQTSWMGSIWYEEVRDIAYAGSDVAGRVYAWDGASTGDPSRPPDRVLRIDGAQGGVRLTGAPGSDRLFVALTDRVSGQSVIMVFDRAHEAVGTPTPDRIIRPSERFDADAMAWDDLRDILYLGRSLDGREVDAYANASTLNGEVSPTRTFEIDYPDRAPNARIGCLVAASENDLLFVTVMNWLDYQGAIVAYSNASSASGTPTPTRFEAYERAVMGLGIFREY